MLNELLKYHKQAVFINGNGFAYDIAIRAKHTDEPLKIRGIFSHVGMIFTKNGDCFLGETCEITVNKDDINIGKPQEGWFVDVYQENTSRTYRIESVYTDTTCGFYLLKCSVKNNSGRIEYSRKDGGI